MTAAIATRSSTNELVRVLVVDDSPLIRKSLVRILGSKGAEVECFDSGESALRELRPDKFDVVITDIRMPGMSGIEFLRQLRGQDVDLPVLLMTGFPEVDTAADAVELNATRYLAKPFTSKTIWEAVSSASRLRRLARLRREMNSATIESSSVDLTTLTRHFDDALQNINIHFQPIVDLIQRSVIAYEVLCRPTSEHIPYPNQLFAAAERLDRVIELGRVIRTLTGRRMNELPEDAQLFVNLHPAELTDGHLFDPCGGLVQHAARVVLEVTERETIDSVDDCAGLIRRLKEVGFRIAIDDLGAGYAGLSSFVQLDPDIVKVDMSLVRDVDQSPKKQRLIESLVQLCAEMGTLVVVEGVETEAERDALFAVGCRWMQGYLFARPTLNPELPVF